MSIKTFNISFPKELADEIDKAAKEQFGSRSDFLRFAAVKYLDAKKELRQLMAEGKKYAQNSPFSTEEEVAEYFTKERRKKEPWRKNIDKYRSR